MIIDNSGKAKVSSYDNHPSTMSIKQHIMDINKAYSFRNVTKEEISSAIKPLNCKKATLSNDIPTKIIQHFNEIFTNFLSNNFNSYLESGMFSNELKLAEVVPVFKRMIKRIKIIIDSSVFFRIFQKFTKDEYFSNFLSKYQCGFRQGFSTQYCLLVMNEKLRKIRNENGFYVTVLTDLSTAFDCIPHQLLIVKLSDYDFDKKSMVFVSTYLKNLKQKTKLGSTFSECFNILFGIPQSSILGPLLYLTFIADLFNLNYDLDDNTNYILLIF